MPNLSNLPEPRVTLRHSRSRKQQQPLHQQQSSLPSTSSPSSSLSSSSQENQLKTTVQHWFWKHRFGKRETDKNGKSTNTGTNISTNINGNHDSTHDDDDDDDNDSENSSSKLLLSSSLPRFSTRQLIRLQHAFTFAIFIIIFAHGYYTYNGDRSYLQNFYAVLLASATTSSFFASNFIIGLAAFQPRALLTLLGFGYALWNLPNLNLSAAEFTLSYSIPAGISIGIQWALDSSMVLCFYHGESDQSGNIEYYYDHDDQPQEQLQQHRPPLEQQPFGKLVAEYWALCSCLPMVLVLIDINIWKGIDQINARSSWDQPVGGILFAISILLVVAKVSLFWKQYRDVRRVDESRLQEFQFNVGKKKSAESIEMWSRTGRMKPVFPTTTKTTTTTTTTTVVSTIQPDQNSNTTTTVPKNFSDRFINELSMILQVFVFGQFHLVILLCYGLGYAHQYFIGNQERMLVVDGQSKALLINVTLLTISRISTGFWFGIQILDPHPDSLNNTRSLLKISQRVNRAFLALVVCSVIGWGLTLGQQAYFSKMCLPPYTACDLFNISKSPRLWVLSAGAMIFQGAMESMSFCFILWMLSLMAGGTFSMATRYTGLMGWSILCGHFTGQVVSTRSIGMTGCQYGNTDCVIVGNGLYEGIIASVLWFVGLMWFAITKEFVQLDELETREIKGEDEVKDGGDDDFEVK